MNEGRDSSDGFDAVKWSREAKKSVGEELQDGGGSEEELEEAASRLGARVVPAPSEEKQPDLDESPGNGRSSDSD